MSVRATTVFPFTSLDQSLFPLQFWAHCCECSIHYDHWIWAMLMLRACITKQCFHNHSYTSKKLKITCIFCMLFQTPICIQQPLYRHVSFLSVSSKINLRFLPPTNSLNKNLRILSQKDHGDGSFFQSGIGWPIFTRSNTEPKSFTGFTGTWQILWWRFHAFSMTLQTGDYLHTHSW